MLFKQTISPFLYDTLTRLMQIDELKDFRLVGGTGLSLQLGHRKSVDIDMFSPVYFKGETMIPLMKKYFPRTEIRDIAFGVSIYLPEPGSGNELKIDLMTNEEYIRPPVIEEEIRLAHIEDIAAMKLEAITSRKEKKDYTDIAELLKTYTINQMVGFYKERYPWNDLRPVVENLPKFGLCDKQPDPFFLNEMDWASVKKAISAAFDVFIESEMRREN